MRKKLDTRFPAARIKRIMQADEEVGKIAMAVPLLMSKALELFLQDLCGQTYEVTLERGAKTLNSLHLKQCVRRCGAFDFLKHVVSKVPDLGCSDAAATEDKSATKRRKISVDEDGNCDESKRIRIDTHSTTTNRRGRGGGTGRGRGGGRGRGRGRGRGSRTPEGESVIHQDKYEEDVDSPHRNDENQKEAVAAGDADSRTASGSEEDKPVRDFDLNVDLNENGCPTLTLADARAELSKKKKTKPVATEVKHEDIPGWSMDDMKRMGIDPVQFANSNGWMDEEDEDYDEEEE
ncbi:hypothetical protein ACP275_04G071300 [Erythranthe tilingii]